MQALLKANAEWWRSGGTTTDDLHSETLEDIECTNPWDMDVLCEINQYVITHGGQASDTHKTRASSVKAIVTGVTSGPCQCTVHQRFTGHSALAKVRDNMLCSVTQREYLTFLIAPKLMDTTMTCLSSLNELATAWSEKTGFTGTARYMREFYAPDKHVPLTTFKFKRPHKRFTTTTHLHIDNGNVAYSMARNNGLDVETIAVMTVIGCDLKLILEALQHNSTK
ncbi:hypothetical protein JKP88DRAFT_241032 [Tribonema minus]|uniref:Uncharacterized protein n=1 Tax=Tribonema minus TaxID=303371 RepID=A0A835ZA86_9STRA|nr:hypothetical protein JKP88DRAFT_241032 [Tribonema minus]